MSVLIKDMEKPKSCYAVIDGEAEFCPFVNSDDDCVLLLEKGICEGTWEMQYSKCPLVEVTEPCEDPRADVYYLAEKIGIHRLYELVVGLRGEPEPFDDDKGCSNCMYSGRPTYKSPCAECRDNSQWEMKPISRSHENGTECEDTISRQAAIDALDQIFDRCEEIEAHLPEGDPDRTGYKMYPDYMTVWKYLHQLSSAQPEPCEDAVSRRILLNDLKELITAWEKYPVMAEQIKGVETAIGYVKAIPSVTPKRKE